MHLSHQGKGGGAGQEVSEDCRQLGADRDPKKSTEPLNLFVVGQSVGTCGSESSLEAPINL